VASAEDVAAAQEALKAELAASPDRILYESYVNDNWELSVMNADGSNQRNLTQTPEIHEHYPQAAPDGAKIAFCADEQKDGQAVRNVYWMNADGTGRTLVSDGARQPCWSADSKKIAFLDQEFAKLNIKDFASKGLYFYDLATKEVSEHPNMKICHLYNPAWSADGKWIVSTVHAGMGFSHGIIAVEIGGMGIFDLGIPGCRPCLSPDGARLTWSSDDRMVNAADMDWSGALPKAANVREVHSDPVLHLYHPDFSPDGKYITFSVGPGGRMPVNGPGTHAELAEMVGVRGPWNLYLKRADGTGSALQLTTDDSTSNKESDWLPTGTAQ
jgi:Tol biopolymer transport system component